MNESNTPAVLISITITKVIFAAMVIYAALTDKTRNLWHLEVAAIALPSEDAFYFECKSSIKAKEEIQTEKNGDKR